MMGDILPIAPTLPSTLNMAAVPSEAPKNSHIFLILNLFWNFSQMSFLNPFPIAILILCSPSFELYKYGVGAG
jgi:hypothetical protein